MAAGQKCDVHGKLHTSVQRYGWRQRFFHQQRCEFIRGKLTLTGSATAAPQHSVALSWNASTSSSVAGLQHLSRHHDLGGPYSKIDSLNPDTTFNDSSVQSGQTYRFLRHHCGRRIGNRKRPFQSNSGGDPHSRIKNAGGLQTFEQEGVTTVAPFFIDLVCGFRILFLRFEAIHSYVLVASFPHAISDLALLAYFFRVSGRIGTESQRVAGIRNCRYKASSFKQKPQAAVQIPASLFSPYICIN